MNKNSEAILIFCSHLCKDNSIKPLETSEWSKLDAILKDKGLEPKDLLGFSKSDFAVLTGSDNVERLCRLVERSGSIQFELLKYKDMGIFPLTLADSEYPGNLKSKLKNLCAPVFYCSGDVSLLNKPCVGYVGSRTVEEDDVEFTKNTVLKTVAKNYGVVSGGAKGIDTVSADFALNNGGFAIEYLSDSMLEKIRNSNTVKHINDGKLLLLSVTVPTTRFNVGFAMARNKFIYAQSDATVVAKAEKGKGGTWSGATENLKKGWCTEYCRDIPCPGNSELIKLGAIPIDDNWNANIVKTEQKINSKPVQLSFDI